MGSFFVKVERLVFTVGKVGPLRWLGSIGLEGGVIGGTLTRGLAWSEITKLGSKDLFAGWEHRLSLI